MDVPTVVALCAIFTVVIGIVGLSDQRRNSEQLKKMKKPAPRRKRAGLTF